MICSKNIYTIILILFLIIVISKVFLYIIDYSKTNFYVKWKTDTFNKNNLGSEYKVLKTLENNYNCTCGSKHSHFPKPIMQIPNLITKISNKFVVNKDKVLDLKLNKPYIMSNAGTNFLSIKQKVEIPNRDKQIDCIIQNLKNNNIPYWDMVPDGRNLCLKEGVLTIIDFDRCSPKDDIDDFHWAILRKKMEYIIIEKEK